MASRGGLDAPAGVSGRGVLARLLTAGVPAAGSAWGRAWLARLPTRMGWSGQLLAALILAGAPAPALADADPGSPRADLYDGGGPGFSHPHPRVDDLYAQKFGRERDYSAEAIRSAAAIEIEIRRFMNCLTQGSDVSFAPDWVVQEGEAERLVRAEVAALLNLMLAEAPKHWFGEVGHYAFHEYMDLTAKTPVDRSLIEEVSRDHCDTPVEVEPPSLKIPPDPRRQDGDRGWHA